MANPAPMVPKEQSWELEQESIQFLSESDALSTVRSSNPGSALLNHRNCGIQQKPGTISTDGRATGIHTDRADLHRGGVLSRNQPPQRWIRMEHSHADI